MVDACLTQATGTAESETALAMLADLPGEGRVTVGADKAYDSASFVAGAHEIDVTPHVAQSINEHRGSSIDGRTTRHPGYAVSQVIRKRIEKANGWIKTVAGTERVPFRGLARMGWMFTFKTAA